MDPIRLDGLYKVREPLKRYTARRSNQASLMIAPYERSVGSGRPYPRCGILARPDASHSPAPAGDLARLQLRLRPILWLSKGVLRRLHLLSLASATLRVVERRPGV